MGRGQAVQQKLNREYEHTCSQVSGVSAGKTRRVSIGYFYVQGNQRTLRHHSSILRQRSEVTKLKKLKGFCVLCRRCQSFLQYRSIFFCHQYLECVRLNNQNILVLSKYSERHYYTFLTLPGGSAAVPPMQTYSHSVAKIAIVTYKWAKKDHKNKKGPHFILVQF